MKKLLILIIIFLNFSIILLPNEYTYPNKPELLIQYFQDKYPDKKERLEALSSALFDITHYTILYLPPDFIKKTADYIKLLIDETEQTQYIGYYYFYLSDYYAANLDNDSSRIMMIKANQEFKANNNYTFLTHSLIVLGTYYDFNDYEVQNIMSPYSLEGYEASLKSNDFFAKDAGAWTMMEFYIKVKPNPDSIYHFYNLSNKYLNNIPKDNFALKNWGIHIKNYILTNWYQKKSQIDSIKIMKLESIEAKKIV